MSYSTSGPVETILRKEDTVDPVAGNDNTQGYDVQSRWINTSSSEEWVCTDASTGAAVWELTTGGDGDVVGPASATNRGLALYDGTTGKLLKDAGGPTYGGSEAGGLTLEHGSNSSYRAKERATGPGIAAGYGWIWVKNTAPTTLIFTDDTGAETTLGAGGGGGGGLGQWDYVTGAGAPAATKITANTDLMSTVTTINVADGSGTDNNFSAAFGAVRAGDYLVVRDSAGGAAFGSFLVTAAPVDNTTYWTFTVSTGDVSGSFTDTNTYDVNIISDGNVVGPTSALSNGVALYNGATGRIIRDSGTLVYSSGEFRNTHASTAAFRCKERASGPTGTATHGHIWVLNDAPTTLWFTDDTDVDHHLNRPTPTTLASNALVDVDATEVVIGGAYLDGSSGGVYSWEILGTYNDNGGGGNQDVIVTLYDRGPDGTPVAGVLRSTITITSLDTLDRISQALTVAASPGTDTDEIDSDEPRLYEIRAKLDANGGVDTAKILNVKFVES